MKSIFVSSTFRDMHFERDVLNKSISPKLNYTLSRYNRSVRILDLRWGVDTTALSEQEASERVLKICSDEIENCMPYMVVLLGDRYGYIPNGKDLSVTHMEIIQGVLENLEKDHVFIYFRQADYSGMPEELQKIYREQNSEADIKLQRLKAELLKQLPERCFEYHSYWSEENQLLISDDFEQMLSEHLEIDFMSDITLTSFESELQKYISDIEATINNNIEYAYIDADKINEFSKNIIANSKPYGVIGQTGAGKSVYMSFLYRELLRKEKKANILFCGDNAFSSSVRNAAEFVFFSISSANNQEYDFEKNAKLTYEELLKCILQQCETSTEDIYILFDAVDKCDNGLIAFILWCYRFSNGKIRVVFSSQDSQEISDSKESFELTELKQSYHELLNIAKFLLKKHGKSLNDELIELICKKATTPLFLNVLLLRLMHLNSEDFKAIQESGGEIDAINKHLRSIIEKHTTDINSVIADYVQVLLSDSTNMDFDLIALCFLGFSVGGLHEIDLQKLFSYTNNIPWVQLDYVDFLARFSFFIRIRNNGRLDISHDALRNTIRSLLSSQKQAIYTTMADYFSNKENPGVIDIKAFFDAAYESYSYRMILDYVLSHKKSFTSFEKNSQIVGNIIRECLTKLYLQAGDGFFIKILEQCQDLIELISWQTTLSSSLLSSNDYLDDNTALKLIKGSIIPMVKITGFPLDIAEMEYNSCRNYIERYNIKSSQVQEFMDYCKGLLDERKSANQDQTPVTKKPENNSPEEMLDLLLRNDAEDIEKVAVFTQLAKLGRKLAATAQMAEYTENLLKQLAQIVSKSDFFGDEDIADMSLADIYTSLGLLYKNTKQWEQSIYYDTESKKIYQRLYEKCPTDTLFRKYRERVYNIANSIEAHAMDSKNNMDLWNEARLSYKEVYELDSIAIAQGIPDRELLICSSSIFSYGTALINSGYPEQGFEKYKEAITIATELSKNNPICDIYLELCTHQLEGVYQLVLCGNTDNANMLCEDLYNALSVIVEKGDSDHINRLQDFIQGFSNNINDIISELFKKEELQNSLAVSKILYNVYCSVLPIAKAKIKFNIIVTQKNIGDIYFLKIQDYQKAYNEYHQLLELVQNANLLVKDEDDRFFDNVNLRLVDVYVRAIICLSNLGREQDIKTMVDNASEWSKYLAAHTESVSDDNAIVLLVIGTSLLQKNIPVGLVYVMLAFNAINEEAYNKEKHKDTVIKVLQALSEFQKPDQSD